MIYNQDITLDLNTSTSYTVVGAKQGDNNSRTLTITIFQDGKLFTIPGGTVASYRIRKPNGQASWNNAEVNSSESKVIITLNATDLSTSGRCFADVLLTNGSAQLATVTFIIDVQAAPAIANQVIESEAFGYLYDVVNSANNIIESAQAWAEGKRGTEDVLNDSYQIRSSNNLSVTLNFETFKNNISPSSIGKITTYNFIYANGHWEYNNNVVDMLELGFTITGTPMPDNYIEVTASFADPTWHNNAKWYAQALGDVVETFEDATDALNKIGDLSSLETNTKVNFIAAINELVGRLNNPHIYINPENLENLDTSTSNYSVIDIYKAMPAGSIFIGGPGVNNLPNLSILQIPHFGPFVIIKFNAYNTIFNMYGQKSGSVKSFWKYNYFIEENDQVSFAFDPWCELFKPPIEKIQNFTAPSEETDNYYIQSQDIYITVRRNIIQKQNSIVTIEFSVLIPTAITNWEIITTDIPLPLPASDSNVYFVIPSWSLTTTYYPPLQMEVTRGKELRIKGGSGPQTGTGKVQYVGTFTYLTSE